MASQEDGIGCLSVLKQPFSPQVAVLRSRQAGASCCESSAIPCQGSLLLDRALPSIEAADCILADLDEISHVSTLVKLASVRLDLQTNEAGDVKRWWWLVEQMKGMTMFDDRHCSYTLSRIMETLLLILP